MFVDLLENRTLFSSYLIQLVPNADSGGEIRIVKDHVFAPSVEDAVRLGVSASYLFEGKRQLLSTTVGNKYFTLFRPGGSPGNENDLFITTAFDWSWHLRVTRLLNIKLVGVTNGSEEPGRDGLPVPLVFKLEREDDPISLGLELDVVDFNDLNTSLGTFKRGSRFCEVAISRSWSAGDQDLAITRKLGLAGVHSFIAARGRIAAPFYLAVRSKIKLEEGFSDVVYRDHLGFWTVGYGHKLANELSTYNKDLDALFLDDLNKAIGGAEQSISGFVGLPLAAKIVVTDLRFNLGSFRKFERFVDCINCSDWLGAIRELGTGSGPGGRSLYSIQVPNRYARNVALLASLLL